MVAYAYSTTRDEAKQFKTQINTSIDLLLIRYDLIKNFHKFPNFGNIEINVST